MEKLVFGVEDKIASLKLDSGKKFRVDFHPWSPSFHFIFNTSWLGIIRYCYNGLMLIVDELKERCVDLLLDY